MKKLIYLLPALFYFASCQPELIEEQDFIPELKDSIDTVFIRDTIYLDTALNRVYSGIEEILTELDNLPIAIGKGRVIDTLITREEKNHYFYNSSNDTITIIESSHDTITIVQKDTIYITPINPNINKESTDYIANSLQVMLNGHEYDLTLDYDIFFAGVGEYLRERKTDGYSYDDTLYNFNFNIESMYGTVQGIKLNIIRIDGQYEPKFKVEDYIEMEVMIETNIPDEDYYSSTSSGAGGGLFFIPETFNLTLKGDKFDIELKTYVGKKYSEVGTNYPTYNAKKVLFEMYGYDLPLGVL